MRGTESRFDRRALSLARSSASWEGSWSGVEDREEAGE
jgi:hypothetical protein